MGIRDKIANSLYPGFNDKSGIMICGYEWGHSKKDQEAERKGEIPERKEQKCIFSNKARHYGDIAKGWPYETRIIKWFGLWGHPLSREDEGGDFEKCIVQTNWCEKGGHKIEGDISEKLREQIDNFICNIKELKPALILFMGVEMIKMLQNEDVMTKFTAIMGDIVQPLKEVQKDFSGTKSNIVFQSFEHCEIVSFPHPSGQWSWRVDDDYIELFKPEMSQRITKVKIEKGIILKV